MTKEDLELIISCSDASTILTDEGWSETYSVPLTITVKELRDLHSTLSAHEKLLNSNKHEPQVKRILADVENQKTILKIFSCQCGETLLIGKPHTKVVNNHNELDYFECKCPDCGTEWKVTISFTEM